MYMFVYVYVYIYICTIIVMGKLGYVNDTTIMDTIGTIDTGKIVG